MFVTTEAYYLTLFLLSPIIIIGLLGNCLSILTWSRGSHNDTSTAVLLTALGIIDTGVLCIPAAEFWTLYVFDLQLRGLHITLCKTFPFLSYFAPAMSSWILVLVTAERFVSMWFPVNVRHMCTRVKVGGAVLVVGLVLALMYSPMIFTPVLNENSTEGFMKCHVPLNSTFRMDYYPLWMWLDLCCLFVLPFIFIVAGNLLILYKLFSSRKMFIKEGRATSFRRRTANSFTVRALALSLALLVCLSPVAVQEVNQAQTGFALVGVGRVLIHSLLYGNSCVNFVLYCVIGTGFRQDMKSVLKRSCLKIKHFFRTERPTEIRANTFYSGNCNNTTQTDTV